MKYVVVLLVCMLAFPAVNAWAIQYQMQDLGVLPDYISYYSEGINNRGEVVGRAYTSTHNSRAFAWDAVNGMRFIEDVGSAAYGINDNGVAVVKGNKGTSLWNSTSGNSYVGYGVPGSCINDMEQTAGGANSAACIWDKTNGKQTIDPPAGYDSAYAYAINNKGQVAGNADSTYPLVHAFFWDSTTGIQDIGCLGGYYSSYAWGMNDLGQVVGDCRTLSQSQHCAYIWDSTNGIQSLGISGFSRDINNSGVVVGEGSGGAFVWDKASGVQYLPGRGAGAQAISDNGLIAGEYIAADGNWHAVIWTPVPEPSSILVLLCGFGGICTHILQRKK